MSLPDILDVLLGLLPIPVGEGRDPGGQLVAENTDGPPVEGLRLSPELKQFRGHVVRGTALGLPLLGPQQHAPPLVGNLDGQLIVLHHYVFWLEVSVQDVLGVDLVEAYYDLLHDVGCLLLGQPASRLPAHVVEQTPMRTLLGQHLHPVFV